MGASNLTDQDIAAIEALMVGLRAAAAMPRLAPLTGWEKEAHDSQERKRRERIAAAKAEEERRLRERELRAEQRRQEWEAAAPARAKVELAEVGQEIAALDAERERLWERARELKQEAER